MARLARQASAQARPQVQAEKPKSVPSQLSIRRLVAAEPALLQAICDLLMVDFVCLGYPLPASCVLQRHATA